MTAISGALYRCRRVYLRRRGGREDESPLLRKGAADGWYYDLSEIKVRKKTPLTLKHFEGFLKTFPAREDSEESWSVDIRSRLAAAQAEADPLRAEALEKDQQGARLKQELAALKKEKPRNALQMEMVEQEIRKYLREGRELTAKADAVISAVYDLKAVNPNRKPVVDTRTPAELIEIIRAKGVEIESALNSLAAALP